MIMPKYFYSDALKAAWMIKEFGFKYFSQHPLGGGYKTRMREYNIAGQVLEAFIDEDDGSIDISFSIKFYLNLECHELLKPQENDILQNHIGQLFKVSKSGVYIDGAGEWSRDDTTNIIQRNGVAFFMPEVEA